MGAPGRDHELDPGEGHVHDHATVHRDHRLFPADLPDLPDAVLEVCDLSIGRLVQGIRYIVGCNHFPGAADPEPNLVFTQVLGQEEVVRSVDHVAGMDMDYQEDPVRGREREADGLDPREKFSSHHVLGYPVRVQKGACTVEDDGDGHETG